MTPLYQFDWSAIGDFPIWLWAIGITLTYAIVTVIAGLVIGAIFGMVMVSRLTVLKLLVETYVQLFRCTPILVQIVWFFYALPMLTGYALPDWLAAGTGLTLYMGAFATEIFRAGVSSIEKGQWEASKALGMTYFRMMWYIILPQATRRMVPPIVSQSILQLKNTSLLSIVAVHDLMFTASSMTMKTFRPLEVYTWVAFLYLLLLFPLTQLSKKLEKRADI